MKLLPKLLKNYFYKSICQQRLHCALSLVTYYTFMAESLLRTVITCELHGKFKCEPENTQDNRAHASSILIVYRTGILTLPLDGMQVSSCGVTPNIREY